MINYTKVEKISGIISRDTMYYLNNELGQRMVSEPVSLTIQDKIAEDAVAYQTLKNMMSIPGKIGILDSNCSTGKTYAALKAVKEIGGLTIFVVPTNAQMKQLEKEYEGCRIITSQIKESARKTKKALYSTDCRIYVTNPELIADVVRHTSYLFKGIPTNFIIDEAHTCLFNMGDYRSKGMQDLLAVLMDNIRLGSNVLLMSGTPEPFGYIIPDNMLKIRSLNQNKIHELKVRVLDRKDNDKMPYADIFANELLSIMREITTPMIVSLNDEVMTNDIEQILKSYNICTGRINQYTIKNNKDYITRNLTQNSMLPRRNETGRNYQVIFATSSIEAGINIKKNMELDQQYIPVLISPKADNANVESEVQFLARLRYDIPSAYIIKKSADKNYRIHDGAYRTVEYHKILAMQNNVTVSAMLKSVDSIAGMQDSIDQFTKFNPANNVVRTDAHGKKVVDYFYAWYLANKNVERILYYDCNFNIHMNYLKEKLNIDMVSSVVMDYSNADRLGLKEMHRSKENRVAEKQYRQNFASKLQNDPEFRKDFINCNMANEAISQFVLSEKTATKELQLAVKFGKEIFAQMSDAIIEGSNKQIQQVHFDIVKNAVQDPCVLSDIINLSNNKSASTIVATSPLGDTLYQLVEDPIVKDIVREAKAHSTAVVLNKIASAKNHDQLRNSFRRDFILDMVNEYRAGNSYIKEMNLATQEIGILLESLTYRDTKDGRLCLNRSTLTEEDYKILADELNAMITDKAHRMYTADMIKSTVSQIMDVISTEQNLSIDELFALMEKQYAGSEELTSAYYMCKAKRQKELAVLRKRKRA